MTEVHDEQAIAGAGPRDEPALVLAHGWPPLAWGWIYLSAVIPAS